MESPGGVEWVMPGSCFHEQWTKKEFLFCNTGAPNPRPACCPLLPVVFHKTSSWCQKCWWLCCNRSSSDSVELHLKKKIKVCVWVGGRKGRKCSLCSGHEVLTSVCQYNGKQFNFGQMKGGEIMVYQRPMLDLSLCPAFKVKRDSYPVLIYGFSLVESRMWISPPKWSWDIQVKEYGNRNQRQPIHNQSSFP